MKRILFFSSLFLFVLVSLFFTESAYASVNENFDSYQTGNIDELSSDWIYHSGGHLQVQTTEFNSAPNGLLLNTSYANGGTLFNPSSVNELGIVSFKFKFNDNSNQNLQIYGQNSFTYDPQIYTEDLFSLQLSRSGFSRFYYDSSGINYEDIGTVISDTAWHDISIEASSTPYVYRACIDGNCSTWRQSDKTDSWDSLGFLDNFHNLSYNQTFDDFNTNEQLPPFAITSPIQDEQVIDDSWITVEGVCPTNGINRIGLTNDCLGFESIEYTLSCTDGTFSTEFYKSGLSDRVVAREIDSVSGDCVDYDDLMDFVTVQGIEFEDGYPSEWYFNFGIYEDYNIQIISPVFDTALTLPKDSTSKEFIFSFTYPADRLNDLTFNIRQYDNEGNLLNESFHTRTLSSMLDTSNYSVTLAATSTMAYHYVVQLSDNGVLKRQFPFGIYVSDLDFVGNPDDTGYFFPRIVEELRKKVVFNYYFAFHDGFYNLFNGEYSSPSEDALDISFKSVSGNREYNINMKIFSASDIRVKMFASKMRPYIVAILWLLFASYVIYRVTHLFSDNE